MGNNERNFRRGLKTEQSNKSESSNVNRIINRRGREENERIERESGNKIPTGERGKYRNE